MSARMRLRRADGRVYLDRWGIERKSLGGVFLHRMDGPDPGIELHDHPWWFVSLILWGGYTEERAHTRDAPMFARIAEVHPETCRRGVTTRRSRFSVRIMRLDECHRITELVGRRSWSLVVHGPVRRRWGFYLPNGWVYYRDYEHTPEGKRRELSIDISNDGDPRVKTS